MKYHCSIIDGIESQLSTLKSRVDHLITITEELARDTDTVAIDDTHLL